MGLKVGTADFAQVQLDSQEREKALDRLFEKEQALNARIHQTGMLYAQHGLNKEMAIFANDLQRETLESYEVVRGSESGCEDANGYVDASVGDDGHEAIGKECSCAYVSTYRKYNTKAWGCE